MKKNLTIITSTIFTRRDYKRYSINKFQNLYNISVINCQSLLGKNKKIKKTNKLNYYYPKSFFELIKIFNLCKSDIMYDMLGLNFKLNTSLIRFYINLRYNCIYYNIGPKIRASVHFTSKDFLLILKNYLSKLIFSNFVFFNTTFLVSSNYRISFFKKLSKKKFIYTHSSDYETFLNSRKNKKKFNSIKYAVFLDEDMPDHPDYKNMGREGPISKNEYYKIINKFFKDLEKTLNVKILIALHPRSNKSESKRLFGKFQIIQNRTVELVKKSEFVLAHVSTSLSYAILCKKKIIILTSNTLNSSWIGNEISMYHKAIGGIFLNLDKYNLSNLKKLRVNKTKYKNYINNFLKHPKSKDHQNIPSLINKI